MVLSRAIEGFLLYKEMDGVSNHTLIDYRRSLEMLADHLGDPELSAITSQDLRSFLHTLRTEPRTSQTGIYEIPSHTLSAKTVKNAYIALGSFYSWAGSELGVESALKGIPPPKVPPVIIEPFTESEIALLLHACRWSRAWNGQPDMRSRRWSRYRDLAMVLFMLDTGVRSSELSGLTIGDCDLKLGRARVLGKGSKERHVVFGTSCSRALWRYLATRDDLRPSEHLFVTREGRRFTRANLWRLMHRLGKRAGVPKVHPHRFRHTFAIQWIRNGGDVLTLQAMLGHSSLEMVRRYARIAEVDLHIVHRRVGPVDNWRLHV